MHDSEIVLAWLSHRLPRIGLNAFLSRTGRVEDDLHEHGSFTHRGNVMNRSLPRARSAEKTRPMATTPIRRNR